MKKKTNYLFNYLYFYDLFPNYIFAFNDINKVNEITIYSLKMCKKIKPYYSSLKHNWRVKLKTKNEFYLQFSLKQLKGLVLHHGKEIFCQLC